MHRWLLALLIPLTAWTVRGPDDRPTGREVDAATMLRETEVDWSTFRMATDPQELGTVADTTHRWLAHRDEEGRDAPIGMLPEIGVTAEDVRRTLAFVRDVAAEDAGAEHQRLADPAWIAAHFRTIRWTSDAAEARRHGVQLRNGRVRLTRYLVFQFEGSLEKTETFDTALYAVPADERDLDLATAERQPNLLRKRYTRQAVMAGVYEPGGAAAGMAEPLVWLTRNGVHESILQGTVEVRLPDGTSRTYNVDRVNGRDYRRGVTSERQERYWYFQQVDGVMGFGDNHGHKVRLRPHAAVAGDAYNLGLGGLYALQGDNGSLRLVVLADTGGAFQPNLYQLDLFTGAYPSREAFDAATRDVPRRVHAYLLVLR